MIKFNSLQDILANSTEESLIKVNSNSKKDIAIIGLDAKFANTESAESYWQMIQNGIDVTGEFPKERYQDIEPYLTYLKNMGMSLQGMEFSVGGYLNAIDKFDYNLFSLSPKEASLMDPNQRFFLEAAWAAIEDAGYGGEKIKGSRTGVFVGYSNDFYDEYRRHLFAANSNLYGLSTVSNIKSIMASRIAYLLDLKGPSLVIDTACSSSLVAVHLACQAIRNGECDQALAGGVKVLLTPIKGEESWELGIQSSDGKAKTFDDSSDGTGTGEGVGVVLLKPLQQALRDGDQIYGVIKGGAINQDGRGVGLTAPNAKAQEDVILRAWKDAGINPETIAYIEAHGTGTKLGDPIEINGLHRAFSKYTTKKQFCAIGSVKTNIGHLDSAAGIAGLIKMIMALKYRQLPPSIHFQRPNRKIPFEDTPVYVNDQLTSWDQELYPRRCGISSFGLSGTNCHLILEEAPILDNNHQSNEEVLNILVLSAKSKAGVEALLRSYYLKLTENSMDLNSVCYTASTGRGHYNCRLVITFKDREDALNKLFLLQGVDLSNTVQSGVYYGEHYLIKGGQDPKEAGRLTENKKLQLTNQANKVIKSLDGSIKTIVENYVTLCLLYIKGADVEWEELYKGKESKKISLPVYPFQSERCWYDLQLTKQHFVRKDIPFVKEISHPVVQYRVASTMETSIYVTEFSVRTHWLLSEHKIFDKYVIPGTTYLEIAYQIGKMHFPNKRIELKDIVFLSPLAVDESETCEVQVIVKQDNGQLKFTVASKGNETNSWTQHAEGCIITLSENIVSNCNIQNIIQRSNQEIVVDYSKVTFGNIKTGPRWNNVEKAYIGNNEVLLHMSLPNDYLGDLNLYDLHPSLLDCAVNTGNAFHSNGEMYLPYTYKSFKIYGPTPARFYSWSKRKNLKNRSGETVTFQIALINEQGEIFAEIEDYTIKKVNLQQFSLQEKETEYHKLEWMERNAVALEEQVEQGNEKILILQDKQGFGEKIGSYLEGKAKKIITVCIGDCYKNEGNSYTIRNRKEDYEKLMVDLKQHQISKILYMFSLDMIHKISIQSKETKLVKDLFHFVKALMKYKGKEELELILFGEYVNDVVRSQPIVQPRVSAMFALGKVIGQEYTNVKVRSIDIDNITPIEKIVTELIVVNESYSVAYRDGKRYVPELQTINLIKKENEFILRKNGTYLITGGTGGIGLQIAKYLADLETIQLVLVNRKKLPPREEWGRVLDNGLDEEECFKIKTIMDIEKLGSKISLYNIDITNETDLNEILQEVRKIQGPINGIFHAAGIAGEGFLILKDEETFSSVLAPKMIGTHLIDMLTRKDPLDCFVLFSSITALTGGMGQGDYTAANSYLDTYASYRIKQGYDTLSINWPAWLEVGMAVRFGAHKEKGLLRPISTESALNGLGKVMNSTSKQIIIGDIDYEVIRELDDFNQFQFDLSLDIQKEIQIRKDRFFEKSIDMPVGNSDKSVTLIGRLETEKNEIDIRIAKIWADVLGLHKIDVYESFYNLGGDSILATRLLRGLEKEFPGKFDISDIFTYSSIDEMVNYLGNSVKLDMLTSEKEDVMKDELDLDKLLNQLEDGDITVSQASLLLTGEEAK